MQKNVTQGSTVTATQYFNGFQYVDGVLQFFSHDEGYVNNTVVNGNNVYNYVFNYTDHLGNVRLSYGVDPATGVLKILEENNYYPFGLKHKNYNMSQKTYIKTGGGVVLEPCISCPRGYQYKYNGKELQDELGLNMYTYGFRDYDPAIGRWNVIDPLAEKSRRWSPYNYCVDNPIRFVDPDGREIKKIEGGVSYTGNDAKIAFMAIRDEINETGGVKVHFVEEAKTPNIYKHTLDSFRKGKPSILHYDNDKKAAAQRRYQATKNYPSRGAEGLQRDEYPYASTFEGGAGANVAYVPASENSRQGLLELAPLYKTMKQGEAFLVLPVPKDKEPDAVPDPVPVSNPIPVPNVSTRDVGVGVGVATAAYITYKIIMAAATWECLGCGAWALP
ncbi:RHS repeat-associated core domain-containing protein [Flavobacterium humi]|uniref:Deoxyribonuclease NucA/NucB domain-containing protein n=1 Tax=Flavobacterium humi TaxID=2562683 RepID=A0A4Z0L291_9FLAO|nr:RHS repeat-associated core domain-containing protein [Flavobacterium humi]TGD56539.1 hypothetical protein E4635_15575 [Flavobacterium humi]